MLMPRHRLRLKRTMVHILSRLPIYPNHYQLSQTSKSQIPYAPRQLQRTVHRIRKMLPKRREQQRPIILRPKVAFTLNELPQTLVAFIHHIRRLQVLRVEPLAIARPDRRVDNGALGVDAQEEVDSGLLVCVWRWFCQELRRGNE